MLSLADELENFLAEFSHKIPDDVRAVMRQADVDIKSTGIEARALKAGDRAPGFTLPDIHGDPVSLAARLNEGPVILTFYRGGWCPYCNLELRVYERLAPQIRAAGANVIAISPQTPDASLDTAESNGLSFDVIADVGATVADAYGLAFELPDALKVLYAKFGHPLPKSNGTDDWRLPVPGTFVIAPNREIILAHAAVDYRTRLEPATALAAITNAAARAAASSL